MILAARREIIGVGAGAALAMLVPSALAKTTADHFPRKAFDAIFGLGGELSDILNKGGKDTAQRLHALLKQAEAVVPAGGGWALHHGRNMAIGIRPVFAHASTRTGRLMANGPVNGQELLALVTTPSAPESDGKRLAAFPLASNGTVRLMSGSGESIWSLGFATTTGPVEGKVSVGLFAPQGNWTVQSY